jgi:hypothetical protein
MTLTPSKLADTSAVSSWDPSSTTIISIGCTVCSAKAERHFDKTSEQLKAGIRTLTVFIKLAILTSGLGLTPEGYLITSNQPNNKEQCLG